MELPQRHIDPRACPNCKKELLQFVTNDQIEIVATLFNELSVEEYGKCLLLFRDGLMVIIYCPGCGYFESLFPLHGAEHWYQAFKDNILS